MVAGLLHLLHSKRSALLQEEEEERPGGPPAGSNRAALHAAIQAVVADHCNGCAAEMRTGNAPAVLTPLRTFVTLEHCRHDRAVAVCVPNEWCKRSITTKQVIFGEGLA
jgi:hypothetical protein